MANRDDARNLMRRGYGQALHKLSASFASPIFWAPPPATSIPSLNHGTIFFLKCGGPILGITADHVYASYLERKMKEPNLVCQIGNYRVDLQERLLARDAVSDLVTFEVLGDEMGKIGKIAHEHPGPEWPPPPPSVGKGVFLTGFPLSGRSFRHRRELDFESVHLGLVADRVDELTITCQFHREDWIDAYGEDTLGGHIDMGGMSGFPFMGSDTTAWRRFLVTCRSCRRV